MKWSAQQDQAWEWLALGPRWQRKPPAPPVAPPHAESSLTARWEGLQQAVASCQACPLAQTRTQTVFGSGSLKGRWALIGEAPGAEEDAQGEAFVGLAGQLLDQMLQAMGWNRASDLFIANILKCRPPGNRNPSLQEARACEAHLQAQLELLRAQAVLIMGRVAAQHLLKQDISIAQLRGRVQTLQIGSPDALMTVPALVTYHPAYLLRNPEDKAKAWEDLNLFAELLVQSAALLVQSDKAASPAGSGALLNDRLYDPG